MRQAVTLDSGLKAVTSERGDILLSDAAGEVMLTLDEQEAVLELMLPAQRRQRERNAFLRGAQLAAQMIRGSEGLSSDEALELYQVATEEYPATSEVRRIVEIRPGIMATTDFDGNVRINMTGRTSKALEPGDALQTSLQLTRAELAVLRDLQDHPTE